MRNFKMYRLFVSAFIIVIVAVSIFLFQSGGDLKYRITTNPDKVEAVVIGNSHANRILLNNKNIFYLNEDGGVITDSIKEFFYSKEKFRHLKYIILNITPMEMYTNHLSGNPYENELLYKHILNAYFEIFEKKVTVGFSEFFSKVRHVFFNTVTDSDDKEDSILFTVNGRELLSVKEHAGIIVDWVREDHYRSNFFIPSKKIYYDNLSKIRKIFANSKFKVAVISMPLNYRYIKNMRGELNGYNLLGLNNFTDDMRSLFGDCYINLIKYPLPDKYFLDGDHLNKDGSIYINEILVKKINKCLGTQYPVHKLISQPTS